MKCFVLSLHRTGTKSLSELLTSLGMKTVHFPARHKRRDLQAQIVGRETDLSFVTQVIRPVIDKCNAVADVPMPVLYRELFGLYPKAKFILLNRPCADWVASVRKSAGGRKFNPFERVQYWHYFPGRPESLDDLTDGELRRMRDDHVYQVTRFFTACGPARLGQFTMGDINCGAAIAQFLGHKSHDRLPTAAEKRKILCGIERWNRNFKRIAVWPAQFVGRNNA